MTPSAPVLLCFDGSPNAAHAIATAANVLAVRSAVVVTVWEPVTTWEPYDPGAVISGGLGRLAASALGLDEIASEVAQERLEQGLELARVAGFEPTGRLARGKTWRAICDLGDELDAAVIVLGTRGLTRVKSALLGSVSGAVSAQAGRPVLVVPPPGEP